MADVAGSQGRSAAVPARSPIRAGRCRNRLDCLPPRRVRRLGSLGHMAMEDTLVCAGFRVTVMHNGREALEADARDRADLLLTDLRMPIMDGMVLIQRLRGGRSGLPVVVVTGTPPEGGVASIQSGDPGRTRLLVKPTLMEDLVTAVQWVIKQPWRHRACRSHFITSGSVVRDASLTAVLSPET